MSANVALKSEYKHFQTKYLKSIMKVSINEDFSKWNIDIFRFDNIESNKLLKTLKDNSIKITIMVDLENYPSISPKMTIDSPKIKSTIYLNQKNGTQYFTNWTSTNTIYEGLCFMHFYLESNLKCHL